MRSDRARSCGVSRTPLQTAAGALLVAILVASAGAAPVIDRVLAVVQGSIVTLSDVNAAMALGLVNTAGAADPVGSALEQLIERSLQLVEVERYAPSEPAAEDVEARLAIIRSRFSNEAELQRMLRATGLTEQRLRAIARDDLRLQAYFNQRFASASVPSDEEVLRYYREHQAEFVRDGTQQTLSEATPEVRRRLEAARRAASIDEWSRSLRLRADVLIIPR
jgi:peptidyl-prolyl cis-trans isomerase SurA